MTEARVIPKGVRQGTSIVWTIITLSILGLLLHKYIGFVSNLKFFALMFYYLILYVIVYKISVGSNIARYAYLLVFIVSTVKFLSSSMIVTGLQLVMSFIFIFFEVFAIYKFFNKDAKEWFLGE